MVFWCGPLDPRNKRSKGRSHRHLWLPASREVPSLIIIQYSKTASSLRKLSSPSLVAESGRGSILENKKEHRAEAKLIGNSTTPLEAAGLFCYLVCPGGRGECDAGLQQPQMGKNRTSREP